MCLHHTQDQPVDVPQMPQIGDAPPPIQNANKQDTVQVSEPTKMGRVMQLLTGGAYDPTGGQDSGQSIPELKPTKFGSLMKIVGPMMQGAAIGGLAGKSTPGGGFAGANQFYQNQRMRQMQVSQFMQEMMLHNAQMQHLQAQAEWERRRPLLNRSAPSIKGTDEQGNQIYKGQNAQTGEWETLQGITPEGPQPNFKEVPTDKGLVAFDTHDPSKGAMPLTMAQPPSTGSAQLPSGPSKVAQGKLPSEFDSGSPRIPGSASQSPQAIQASASAVPLQPPGKQRNAKDDLEEQVIQEDKKRGLSARATMNDVAGLTRKPDQNDQPLSGHKYDAVRNKFQTQLNSQLQQSESRRKSEIAALHGGATDEELQKIEEDNADRKQQIHQQLVDTAAAQGVNLGTVPDYRAQLNGGGVPTTAPGQSAGGNRVNVIHPDGRKGSIPVSQLAEAKKKGYKEVSQ